MLLCIDKRFSQKILVLSLFALFSNATALAADGGAANESSIVFELCPASKHERVLHFPTGYSLGQVEIKPYPPTGNKAELRGAAKGTVKVPANHMVRFIPSQHFYSNPAIVKTLPVDGIDSLELTASAMFDGEEGLCDRALSHVGHLKSVVELILDRSDATDKGLAYAEGFPNLQKISAFTAAMQGDSFKHLSNLKKLRVLRLSRLWLKEENLRYFSQLPCLEFIVLTRANISDLGVKYLSDCKNLLSISMADNPKVTDKCIPYLLKLKKLRNLMLGETSITGAGLVKLAPLQLKVLELPVGDAGIANLHEVRKALSTVSLRQPAGKHKKLDSDMGTILSPLH